MTPVASCTRRLFLSAMCTIVVFGVSTARPAGAHTNAALEWNAIATRASCRRKAQIRSVSREPTRCCTRPSTTRSMPSSAVRVLYTRTDVTPGASPDAAVAAAAHDVLVVLIPTQLTLIEDAYVAALAAIPNGPRKTAALPSGRRRPD